MIRQNLLQQTTAPGAGDILARCRALVQPALLTAMERLHPQLQQMAGFSFGWCDQHGTPETRAGTSGKGIRQALAVLSAEAAGGSAEMALPGAVAVELVHAFSLVHDDIMDGDEKRRHRATLWKAYGVGPALLAGDALLGLAVETVVNVCGEHALEAVRYLAAAITDLACGQAQDLDFEDRPWTGANAVAVDEYQAMADQKTGALLRCAAAIGAVLTGGPPPVIRALAVMGLYLGRAFQAVDDLLGICGDPSITGKPIYSDLRRGKKTLPILAAINSGTSPGHRLGELLNSHQPLDENLFPLAAALIEEAGGLCRARQESQRNLTCALRILDNAPIANSATKELAAIATFLDKRAR
ncbi:MAG: polyprenyl synthetase family protein [Pseudonocardiales bacterium]|nr:polyprenyl synthetase family protein [Pseudonocardiales bacterium]